MGGDWRDDYYYLTMPSEITTDHTSEGVAQRGNDGSLIPETHTVELPDGSEVVIKTKPITTGLLNELSNVDDAIAELEPKAVREAFQTVYVSEAITGLSVEEIRDTRSEYLTAYLQPLDEAVEDDIGDSGGNPAELSKGERAREMR